MRALIFILITMGLFGCKFNDDIRFDTSITYGKTIKLIAPSSDYFDRFNKAFEDGVIDGDEFYELEFIYRKHMIEFEKTNGGGE